MRRPGRLRPTRTPTRFPVPRVSGCAHRPRIGCGRGRRGRRRVRFRARPDRPPRDDETAMPIGWKIAHSRSPSAASRKAPNRCGVHATTWPGPPLVSCRRRVVDRRATAEFRSARRARRIACRAAGPAILWDGHISAGSARSAPPPGVRNCSPSNGPSARDGGRQTRGPGHGPTAGGTADRPFLPYFLPRGRQNPPGGSPRAGHAPCSRKR